jgi:stage V sporulation protein G
MENRRIFSSKSMKRTGSTMNVTDVKIRRIYQEGKMKAIASVTFDQAFVIHDMKVVQGVNGLFLAMPSRRTMDGVYRDIAHPISSEARERVQQAVLDAYQEASGSETLAAM